MLRFVIEKLQGKLPKGARRSPKWPAFRDRFLKSKPRCSVCGGTKAVELHHVVPFHLAPERELDLENVIALCESKRHGVNCHLFFGHLGNYRNVNDKLLEDLAAWSGRI